MDKFRLQFLLLLPFFVLLLLSSSPAQTQVLFSTRFEELPNGSDGAPLWHITKGNWVMEEGIYRQLSYEYDCGAMHSLFVDRSVEITVRFRCEKGDLGAGLFFSSANLENTNFAQMVRFDGPSRLLLGYFENGEFKVQDFGFVAPNPEGWQELSVRLDLTRRVYSVIVNGTTVADSIQLMFQDGYWGLESSAGITAFDEVSIRQLDGSGVSSSVFWPKTFAVSTSGNLLIPDPYFNCIRELDINGTVSKKIPLSSGSWPIQKPDRILALPNGHLVISDAGNRRLHLFGDSGEWLACTGGKSEFDVIRDLAYWATHNRILLLEKGRKRIVVLTDSLRRIQTFGQKELLDPVAVAASGKQVAVLDNARHQILLFGMENKSWRHLRNISFPTGNAKDLAFDGRYFYLLINRQVWKLNLEGEKIAEFSGSTLAGYFPVSVELEADNRLWIADFTGSRLVYTNLDLFEPNIRFIPRDDGAAIFTWESLNPARGGIQLSLPSGETLVFEEKETKTSHSFVVENLPGSQIIHAAVYPGVGSVPGAVAWTKSQTMLTPPPTGMMPILRLPALCIVYANISKNSDSEDFSPPPLEDCEIQRIKNQILDGVRFYWIHSRFRFWVDMDFLIVRKQISFQQLVEPRWWYPPREDVLDSTVLAAGKSINAYKAVFCLIALQEKDPKTEKWQLSGRGGGFTNGIAANSRYGLSWWMVTRSNHPAGNNWLMVHEFNHQVDELFQVSGYPEYWFNHFASKLENVGPFGEHFDGNAYLMHLIPPAWWLDLKYGERLMVQDLDGDGIPDADPRLPLDEQRLGSSPVLVDTDYDGASDLKEMLFSNWVIEGQGETYGGKKLFPQLNNPDTDGDGLQDGDDPEPLFPFPTTIRKVEKSSINGRVTPGKWPEILTFEDSLISAKLSVAWDSAALYWRIQINRPVPFKLQIDADNDGWFLGKDNWLFTFQPEKGSFVLKKQLFDASSYTEWPHMNPDASSELNTEIRTTREKDGVTVELAVFRNAAFGFQLTPGEKLGFNVGFLCLPDTKQRRYRTVFEPNRFFHAQLQSNIEE